MRITPFREILWAVAYKLGIDPTQSNFLTNQAESIGTFIDSWVDRVYSHQDWPEWTLTKPFQPDNNHIVSWNDVALDTGTITEIGRVLQVYLVDPVATDTPVATRFSLRDTGIHCGLEHGSSVWIEFMSPRPMFTSTQWDAGVIYKKDDVAYSYTTGEVYRSKVSGNIGHDPSFTFSHNPNVQVDPTPVEIDTDLRVPLTADQPGIAAQTQKVVLTMTSRDATTDIPPNPPPNLSLLGITVVDVDGNLLSSASHFANGTDTLDVILDDLTNQLISDLGGGWNVTQDTANLTITLENASQFNVVQWVYVPNGGPAYNLLQKQSQTYIPAVAGVAGTKQQIVFTLTQDNVVPGATYYLNFRDVAGADHIVSYVALPSDQSLQIQSALISAAQQQALSDPFFSDIGSTLDTTSLASTFSSSTKISIGSMYTLPGSPWWELVPFPSTIAQQVIRGAYADLLKEWGQATQGATEEGAVPQETQLAASDFDTTPNPPLTGQQKAMSRYKLS